LVRANRGPQQQTGPPPYSNFAHKRIIRFPFQQLKEPIMAVRKATAAWQGNVMEGRGELALESGTFKGPYDFRARTADGTGMTNPEELIAAAHAGCFTMAFSATLGKSGFTAKQINTEARVHLVPGGAGFVIPRIDLIMTASVPDLDAEKFQELATSAKVNCPVSKALAGCEITLQATLV
jgi:lipoyl-dependent peroxiredoxin